MNLINQLASGAKDLMLEKILGAFLNAKQLTEPETKTTLRLDANKHRLFLHLRLKGEATPTDLTISYQITEDNEIEILGIESEKHWIPNTVALILAKRRFKFHAKELLPDTLSGVSSEALLSVLR